MMNLPLANRRLLEEKGVCVSSQVEDREADKDGTVKLRIRLYDGYLTEAVVMTNPSGTRTACLSSQVGCPVGCLFCNTGKMGFSRNLADYEIAEQLLHLKAEAPGITHIVYMGMGEPLLNLEAVRRASNCFHHPKGLGMSFRRMTVSTCGLVKEIGELAQSGPPVGLAVSLITAVSEDRRRLVPAAGRNTLPLLKQSLVDYQRKTGRRITLEIVLMDGVTDRQRDLDALFRFASGLKVMVNLISWNPVSDMPFRASDPRKVGPFARAIEGQGIRVVRRVSRGRGVQGACGQLFARQT